MGLWKDLIDALGTKEVVGYGSNEHKALIDAVNKLPSLFPLGSKQYFSSYEQSITPCESREIRDEITGKFIDDEITQYEAKIVYALTRKGKIISKLFE